MALNSSEGEVPGADERKGEEVGGDDVIASRPSDHTSKRVTVVAEDLRVRYRVTRTDRAQREGLLGRLIPDRKQQVSVAALRGISFSACAGEFVGVIGRNGSGKSTLLRVLSGLEPPSSGSVLTAASPMRLGVNAALIADLTGAQNIRLGGLAQGLTPDEVDAMMDEVIDLSALGDAIDLPMRTYSSGMGARLKFAISLMKKPEILMIDEALSTGDASFADRARVAMNGLLERSGTVFLVSHAAQTIETMCSRAIWLDRGRMVLDGDAVEVARKYRWFAHNLAQGQDEVADGLLRDAIAEGEAQKADVSGEGGSAEPVTAGALSAGARGKRRRIEALDDPDPFRKIFTEDSPRRKFPASAGDRRSRD